MELTPLQISRLKEKLSDKAVKTRSQGGRELSYLEAWYIIDQANGIFGIDGWNRETVYCKEVSRENIKIGDSKKDGFRVGYEAKVKVTVGCITREGTGHGSGSMTSLFDAIESASKEAESDAMKRAFMTFGYQFGLALYDKTKEHVESSSDRRAKEGATKFTDGLCYEILQCKTLDDLMSKQTENSTKIQKLINNYPELAEKLSDVAKLKMAELGGGNG